MQNMTPVELAGLAFAAGVLFTFLFFGLYEWHRRQNIADPNLNVSMRVSRLVREACEGHLRSTRHQLKLVERNAAAALLPEELHRRLAVPVRQWSEEKWVESVKEWSRRDADATKGALESLKHDISAPYARRTARAFPKREPSAGGGVEIVN